MKSTNVSNLIGDRHQPVRLQDREEPLKAMTNTNDTKTGLASPKPDFTQTFLLDLVAHLHCKTPDVQAVFNLCRLRAFYAQEEHADLAASHAALVSALENCAEIMQRVYPRGLPVAIGRLCEERDWDTDLRNARKALSDARNLSAGMEGGAQVNAKQWLIRHLTVNRASLIRQMGRKAYWAALDAAIRTPTERRAEG